MHMKPTCVGKSEQAIYGRMEISLNVLTFCNDCNRNTEKVKNSGFFAKLQVIKMNLCHIASPKN